MIQNDYFYTEFLNSLNVDEQKFLLRFFILFSRFEYSLKETGYSVVLDGDAKPNWDAFANHIETRNTFNANRTQELHEAVEYLVNNPPRKQVVQGGVLAWDATNPEPFSIRRLLILVRRVRNNLFHGGKFRQIAGGQRQRDFDLMKHSLTVLEECLELHPNVKRHFLGEFA